MALNLISRFANETNTTSETYDNTKGIRYSDTDWFNLDSEGSIRKVGFLPLVGISSVILNTTLNQTTFVSYIVGNILGSYTIRDKTNKFLINGDITVENDPDEIAKGFSTFLNRINNIRNNSNTTLGESVWRARQLGSSDNTVPYWYIGSQNEIAYNSNGSTLNLNGRIYANNIYLDYLKNCVYGQYLGFNAYINLYIGDTNSEHSINISPNNEGNVSVKGNLDCVRSIIIQDYLEVGDLTDKGNPDTIGSAQIKDLELTEYTSSDSTVTYYGDIKLPMRCSIDSNYNISFKALSRETSSVELFLQRVGKYLDKMGW